MKELIVYFIFYVVRIIWKLVRFFLNVCFFNVVFLVELNCRFLNLKERFG